MNPGKKEITPKQTYAAPVDTDEVQKVINDMIGQCSASVFKNYLPYVSRAFITALVFSMPHLPEQIFLESFKTELFNSLISSPP